MQIGPTSSLALHKVCWPLLHPSLIPSWDLLIHGRGQDKDLFECISRGAEASLLVTHTRASLEEAPVSDGNGGIDRKPGRTFHSKLIQSAENRAGDSEECSRMSCSRRKN